MATDFAPTGVTTDYWTTSNWIFANTNGHACLGPSVVTTGPDGTLWIGSGNNGQLALTQPNGFVRLSRAGDVIDFAATDAEPMAGAIGADGNMYALVEVGTDACALRRFDAQGHETTIANDPSIIALGCLSLVAGPDHRLWMTGRGAFNGTSFPLELVAFDPNSTAMTGYPTPQLGFIASYLTAGPDEGIWFDAVPSAVGRFDIGSGPSRAFVTPSTVSFAPTGTGVASGSQAIAVLSTGTAPLTIGSVSITGGDSGEFQIVANGCAGASLAPGTSCTIVVTSQPTHPGSHSATLVITDNDGFSPQTVRLEEYTVPRPPTASPSSISFPTTAVGQQSASKTITLKNNGDRPLHVQYAGKDGTDAADFPILSDTCSNADVPVGGTCVVVVAFKPLTAGGTKTATLTFNDAANPPQQVVTLNGGAQSTGGGSGGECACSKTGTFVEPAEKLASTGTTSADPIFSVQVTGPVYAPTHLTINKNNSSFVEIDLPSNNQGSTQVAWDVLAEQRFGFSPDGDRFVVHYEQDGVDYMRLYDLTSATPATPVWTNEGIPINPGGTATSPSGSMAFSPHGDYLVAANLQTTGLGSQQLLLFLVSSSGAEVGSRPTAQWTPSAAPKANKAVQSAHWGFGPDDQSFVMVRDDTSGLRPRLELITLPSGTFILDQSFPDASWYVQFSPCGDVLGVITDNGVHATAHLFSTTQPLGSIGELGSVPDLPAAQGIPITLIADPANFKVSDQGASLVIAPNTAAAGCAAATSSGSAGGSGTPANFTLPVFTSGNPPNVGFQGVPYTFTFTATGQPTPTFELESDAPSWLKIDSKTGVLTGTPPVGTTSFTYTVGATNSLNNPDFSGPWTVTVTPPNPPPTGGGGPGGPTLMRDDEELETSPEPSRDSSSSPDQNPLPAPADLILPNGRGDILLAADVTPAVSVFTYTETDSPVGAARRPRLRRTRFTLTAVDAGCGAPVTNIVDAARATIVFSADELRAVRVTDPSRLGVYWWSGTTWINQLPCAGCGYSVANADPDRRARPLGEYTLAAVPRRRQH